MSRYETYKESDFVGIGKVPEHWEVKRLKHLGEAIIGLTYSPNDVTENEEGILVLRSSNIQEGFISYEDCVYVDKEVNPNLITRKGDILICARNGSAHLVGKNICIDEKSAGHTFGAFMVVFRGKFWRYLSYFFNSPIFTSQTGMFSTTTINQLTSQTLNNLRIAYPSDSIEQENICNYLDDQTQKIDRLIANKKAQAEKLKELRQIEINNAVTKGLNPNAEMKDSGIEWLGKIPKHWEVKRLKNVANYIQTGITPPSGNSDYYDGEIPWYGPGGFNGETVLSNPAKYITKKAIDDNEAKLFPVDCVFMIGIGATIGKVGIIKEPSSCNQQLNIINFKSFVNPDFGVYFLKIYESVIINIANFSTLPIYNQVQTGNLKFLLPPKKEQDEIFDYLQQRTTAIDQLIKNIEAQIEKLQELRKIKIYEAVTGKIKVL
ncbi:restriction endonuclease subunit S [Sphingobacteriales bacterium UPWRP_1]|nr:hypothetical protein BVG80_03545 [Sphingobacteriales bacterium TSM_CSM]PSJ75669.1 restriction endonuclease subunit S [Sphingobacteriales bacterium UPWRP_1]